MVFMRMMTVGAFCFWMTAAYAFDLSGVVCSDPLTPQAIEQVRMSKQALADVDAEPWAVTVDEFNNTACPFIQVLMLDAMARTYTDLIRDYDLKEHDARVRLYDKIKMNMAFLQFTGGKSRAEGAGLNCLIQEKLRNYLPNQIWEHPHFFIAL